jgi:ATP-dependent Clp protease ATP-binding subunit ClpA
MRLPERLSDHAKMILDRAKEEAADRGADFFDTGHVLLGIVGSAGCLAWRILSAKGVHPGSVRVRLDERLPRYRGREGTVPRMALPTRQVLSLAEQEAERLGHSVIGTEHILLGLLDLHEGLAHSVLADMGVQIETTRVWVGEISEHETRARHEVQPKPSVFPYDILDIEARAALCNAIRLARSLGLDVFTAMHLVYGAVQALPTKMHQGLLERGLDVARAAEAVSKRLAALPEPRPDDTMPPDRAAKEVLAHALLLCWAHDRGQITLQQLVMALHERGEDSVRRALEDWGIRAGDLTTLR